MIMNRKLNILGTEYSFVLIDKQDEYMKNNGLSGYVNYLLKRIVIWTKPIGEDLSLNVIESNFIIKHEIIHAFLYESGLPSEVCNFHTEDCVEFFTKQFSKILEVVEEGTRALLNESVGMDNEEIQSDHQ